MRGWVKALPLLWITVGVILMARIWSGHFTLDVNWRGVFDRAPGMGADCRYAMGVWQEGDTFQGIATRPHDFQPLAMPYKGVPVTDLTFRPDAYMLTECPFDARVIKPDGFAWMQLGPAFGSTGIFVNGVLRQTLDDDRYAEFPLLPEDRTAPGIVTIVSRASEKTRRPGLGSAMPLRFTDSRYQLDEMNGVRLTWQRDIPMFRLGFALALLFAFAIVWLAGVRYPDVGWMLGACALNAAIQAISFWPAGTFAPWRTDVRAVLVFSLALSLAGFLATFLRLPWKERWLQPAFLLVTAAYAALIWLMPRDLAYSLSLTANVPNLVGALLFAALVPFAHSRRKDVIGRRRVFVSLIVATITLASVCYFGQAITAATHGIQVRDYVNYLLTTTFCAFLMIDLVVFHRGFFEEKAHRLSVQDGREQLEDGLAVGAALQRLLLPKELAGAFGPFTYQYLYEPSHSMGGDWIHIWQASPTELRLFLGDVVGKGPPAALAASALVTLLRECQRQALDVPATVAFLHDRIRAQFEGAVASTFHAACLHADGRVQLFSNGTQPWIALSPAVELHPLRAQHLGRVDDPTPATTELRPTGPGFLLTCSDGVLDIRRLDRCLTALRDADAATLDHGRLHELLLPRDGDADGDDDKTILTIGILPDAARQAS